MITEQIHQLSGCVDVKCEYVGVSAMKMFDNPLTLATLGNMDDSNVVLSNTLQAGFIARWWKPLYVFNKSGCQGQQNLHGSTRRRPTCRWNDIRGQKLCLPLRVMDTFREGRNKEQLFSVIQPLIWGKLLAAAAAAERLPCDSYDVTWFGDLILSISQRRAATSGRIPTAVTVK